MFLSRADVLKATVAMLVFLVVPALMLYVGIARPDVTCICPDYACPSTSVPTTDSVSFGTDNSTSNITFGTGSLTGNLTGNSTSNITFSNTTSTATLVGNITSGLARRTVIKLKGPSKKPVNTNPNITTTQPTTADMSNQRIQFGSFVLGTPSTGITAGVWLIVGACLLATLIISIYLVILLDGNSKIGFTVFALCYLTFFAWNIVGAKTYTATRDMCNAVDTLASLDMDDPNSSISWLKGETITFLIVLPLPLLALLFAACCGVRTTIPSGGSQV